MLKLAEDLSGITSKDLTLFQALDRFQFKYNNELADREIIPVSSNYYSEEVNQALELIVEHKESRTNCNGKAPNTKFVVYCATLLGMNIFRGYARVEAISKIWKEKSLDITLSKEEKEIHKNDNKYIHPFKEALKQSKGARNMHVSKDVSDYINQNCGFYNISKGDMCIYFEALGLIALENINSIYNEWVTNSLKSFKGNMARRVYEREQEIISFYMFDNKDRFDSYLESAEGVLEL